MTTRARATAEAFALAAAFLLSDDARAERPAAASAGERFYLTGLAPGGQAVPAVVQGDLRVTSAETPCASCHRRSGWAGSEGSISVAPIAAPALFAPVTRGSREMGALRTSGAGTRPAYTDATLLRAVREGIDAGGRTLSALMPRYALGDEDAAALIAHLRSLAATPPPGVTDSQLHLATLTSTGVAAADREALLQVVRAYVRDKNAGTRNEARRRERGPWDMKQHYSVYRDWVLHEWELEGAVASWPAQLARLYAVQPVFAVVSGIVGDDAAPLHDFAERMRVPVILPQTPLPPAGPPAESYYSLYFSRGLALEADVLAERLGTETYARLVQLARCGAAAEAAARRLAGRVSPTLDVRTSCYDGEASAAVAELRDSAGPRTAVALWLGAADAEAVLAALPPSTGAVYLSSSLLASHAVTGRAELAERVMLLEPEVPQQELERHAFRSLAWLKAKGLAGLQPRVAVNALYPLLLAGEALGHPTALASREYFLERIETMAARSPHRSTYPEIVFGPQRRFGSAGCYVLQAPETAGMPFRKVGVWTVPRS
jgi:hypothetical protein